MTNQDVFEDCRFGDIDFSFSPVFQSFIVHNRELGRSRCVLRSLKELALLQISRYSSLTLAAVSSVPVSLLSDLLHLSVSFHRLHQLALLVKSWPMPVLKLLNNGGGYDYIEEIRTNVDQRKHDFKMKSEVAITALNKTIPSVQSEEKSCINCLDITNFPMTFRFLSQTSASLGSSRSLRVISDVVVTDSKVSIFRDFNFTLQVRHLHLCCHDCHGVSSEKLYHLLTQLKLLPNIDLNYLEGLQISRLDLRAAFSEHKTSGSQGQASEFFAFISEEFPNISCLDLSYNAVNLNGDERATSILQKFLSSLSKLNRLNIGGNRLTNKVPSILRDSPGLQYLNLTGTQLRQLDVSYLATLIWINHLDLSSNKLHNKLNVLRRMLEQLHNLQILEMIDCDLDDECLDEIIPAFKILEKLEVVNLTNNLILRHDFNVNQCRILTG